MEEKQKFSTGAVRNLATGRGAFELLPTRCLTLLAKHFEDGAAAHGDRNWERGIPLARHLQSALRHSFQYLEGQGDIHAISALWNWSVLIETSERIKAGLLPKELDDLSKLPSWQEPKKDFNTTFNVPPIDINKCIDESAKAFNESQEAQNLGDDFIHPNIPTPEECKFFYEQEKKEFATCNQDVPSAVAQDELLKRVDEQFVPEEDNIKLDLSNSYTILINDQPYKSCNVEYKHKNGVYHTIIKAEPLEQPAPIDNHQNLVWYTFQEKTPDNNKELLCEYNISELKRFSPNFPIAKYCISFANSLDRSLFTRWAYLSNSDNTKVHPKTYPAYIHPTYPITKEDIKVISESFFENKKHILPPKKELNDGLGDFYRWRLTSLEKPVCGYWGYNKNYVESSQSCYEASEKFKIYFVGDNRYRDTIKKYSYWRYCK